MLNLLLWTCCLFVCLLSVWSMQKDGKMRKQPIRELSILVDLTFFLFWLVKLLGFHESMDSVRWEWGWGNAFEWCAPIIGKGQFSVMNTQVPTNPRSLKCVCCNNRPRNEQLINESSVRFDSIRSPEWGSGASSKFQHPSSLHSLDFSSSSSSPPCCCWCRRRRCYWPIITIAEWQWILNSPFAWETIS